ncbi:MAG: EamA family transporter [Chloroflexi bacterium]|nr:EamA family transporter [Chloroflexota bacterium]
MVWIALATVYVVWGSTYLAIAFQVRSLPPLTSAGVRFLVAGAIVVAWLVVRGRPDALRVTRRELLGAAGIGCLLLVGGNALVVLAERSVPSGLAALIVASVPLWVVLWRRVAGERIPRLSATGVAVGFSGVLLLVVPRGIAGGTDPLGIVFAVAAPFCWSAGSFLSRRVSLPRDPLASTGVQMLFAGVLAVCIGLVTDGPIVPSSFTAESLLALGYLIVFGSVVAFTAYTWLLQHAPVSQVATYAYVNPVIALFLGALVLGEPITPLILAGAAIIVVAVAIVVTQEGRARTARNAEERA